MPSNPALRASETTPLQEWTPLLREYARGQFLSGGDRMWGSVLALFDHLDARGLLPAVSAPRVPEETATLIFAATDEHPAIYREGSRLTASPKRPVLPTADAPPYDVPDADENDNAVELRAKLTELHRPTADAPTAEPCKKCRGRGFVGGNPYPCDVCHGRGTTPDTQSQHKRTRS